MNNLTQKWNDPAYQRISSVSAAKDMLVVTFDDGAIVELPLDQLSESVGGKPAWSAAYSDVYEIIVPTASGEFELPWSTIRLMADSDFAQHWNDSIEEETDHIGLRLKELRQRRKMTGKEVAKRAGITPQSMSRIENGHHDVVYTTLSKILTGMGYTLKDLAKVDIYPRRFSKLLSHLEQNGFKREWVLDRFLPKELIAKLASHKTPDYEATLNLLAENISTVFSWPQEDILRTKPLKINRNIISAANYKSQGRTVERQASIYAVFAHYLANITADATRHLPTHEVPENPDEITDAIAQKYGDVDFQNLLRYTWDLGIPVIPLSDSGAFHGACWRINGRIVIVLKQVTRYHGRWLIDLSHELGHAALHLNNVDSLLESNEISAFDDGTDEEWEAGNFSTALALQNRAEELAEISVASAENKVELLKSTVVRVAKKENVAADVLANYLAFRLSKENDINWWGTANNLQISDPPPIEVARKIFYEKVEFGQLNDFDSALLKRALD